jgi:dTDP-4-dehydrorhamnose 3,5-epimerase
MKKAITDVKVFTPNIFHDFRGEFTEIWSKRYLDIDFVEDDLSCSRKNVLRGLHGDYLTWKLLQCIYGALYFVVVDCRPESSTYKSWEAFTLNDKNRQRVLVPPGCANGHLCLSETCMLHYKQTTCYGEHAQFTLAWNALDVFWPIRDPILSERDRNGKKWEELCEV